MTERKIHDPAPETARFDRMSALFRPARRAAGLAALVAALFVSSVAACRFRPGREPFEARVVGVADGDTITVLHRGAQVRVRLSGIDCPERGQPFSARAKQFTSEMVFGKTVTVRPFGTDRYRRAVADVVLPDGRVLNRELVAAGLAWHYTRYSKDEVLARLEKEARGSRLGLWSEERAVAPWDFRR